jgi:hypothetical protein
VARGRMISKSLSTSQRYAQLAKVAGPLGEFSQALFPLMVAHADDFGRISGDAFTVKHLCHPTSRRSVSQFEVAILAMETVGLIAKSDEGGVNRIQINNFDDHQTGLHKRTASKFPEIPGNSGGFPLKRTELKGTEQKGSEENRNEPPPALVRVSPLVSLEPKKDDVDVGERAAWFVARYSELYTEHRKGARYLPRPSLDYEKAKELCAVWASDRLERLAAVFLTTDHTFAASGSRTIGQFAALASWCDDRLTEWEAEHGAKVGA